MRTKVIWTAVAAALSGGLSLVFAVSNPRMSVALGIFSVSMAILSTRERV